MQRKWTTTIYFALLMLLLAVLAGIASGRYFIMPLDIVRIFFSSQLDNIEAVNLKQTLIYNVRLPRVIMAMVTGAGLAGSGVVLQNLFKNPLAEPGLLGISSGSAFGGIVALLLYNSTLYFMTGALIGGILALLLVMVLAFGRFRSAGSGTLILILSGIVVSALFSSGVSLLKLIADPQNQLPAIVFWLLGSLATADYGKIMLLAPPILSGLFILWRLRYHLMVQSVENSHVYSGNNKMENHVRIISLIMVSLIVACTVAGCGVVGWVGLVVPHLVRLAYKNDYRYFFLHVCIWGATYFVVVDILCRVLSAIEIPVGILTSFLGAPVFILLLGNLRRKI